MYSFSSNYVNYLDIEEVICSYNLFLYIKEKIKAMNLEETSAKTFHPSKKLEYQIQNN